MNNPTPTPGYLDRVEAHLKHAMEKHPHFADWIFTDIKAKCLEDRISGIKASIANLSKWNAVTASQLMQCETYEAWLAYASGDYAHAADECYDAIAVLLRMAFWLDQMAAEKKGESK